jgi:integrating conjugative element protein (TIGR03758 family)
MNAAQQAAFTAATGHAPGAVNTLIGSLVLVLVFLFAAWLVTRTLSALYRGKAHELDLLWVGIRASALIAIAIYVVN